MVKARSINSVADNNGSQREHARVFGNECLSSKHHIGTVIGRSIDQQLSHLIGAAFLKVTSSLFACDDLSARRLRSHSCG